MELAIRIIQIVSAILLIITILMQNRGTGLSSTFGGGGEVFRTKRGVEKLLFRSTIVLAIIFLASALATLVLPQ